MKKIFVSIALVLALAAARGAAAAEAIGWITFLDYDSDRIYLHDGRSFSVSEEINFSALRGGVRVRLRYETIGNDSTVTDIELAPQKAQISLPPSSTPLCGHADEELFSPATSSHGRAVC